MTDETSERRPPAWVDKATLMRETCLGNTTIDEWVKAGALPAPRKVRGKQLWRWSEVDRYLDRAGKPEPVSETPEDRVRRGTAAALQEHH